MQSVITEIRKNVFASQYRNGDIVDQLHYHVTVFAFALFAAVIVVLEYVGEPINCWNYGGYVQKHYQDHVNQYCWTHSLYNYPNLSNRSVMPYTLNQLGAPEVMELKGEDSGRITFYRWGTVIFLVQALMFKLPNLVWGHYCSYFGCNIVKMVEVLQDLLFAKKDDREQKLPQVALFLHKWLDMHRERNYLSIFYLVTKMCFFVNNLFQFYILSAFLEINYWHFGVETLKAVFEEVPESLPSKTYFPTLAICHFRTYNQGSSAAHPVAKGKWVQCILKVNIFLGKMFLIEWFWLLLLLGLTIGSFIYWCCRIFSTTKAKNYVHRLTRLVGREKSVKDCQCDDFIEDYLGNDGIFIVRILAYNTNELIVAQLMERMRDIDREEKNSEPKSAQTDKVEMIDENSSPSLFKKKTMSTNTDSGLLIFNGSEYIPTDARTVELPAYLAFGANIRHCQSNSLRPGDDYS